MAKWIVRGLIVLATTIFVAIVFLSVIAFRGLMAFDIQYGDRYIVVPTYRALLLLLIAELIAIATAVYVRRGSLPSR